MKAMSATLGLVLLLGCDAFKNERARNPPSDATPSRAWILEQKVNCSKLALSYHDRLSKDLAEMSKPDRLFLLNPHFCYSDTLNTCLYFGGMTGKDAIQLMVLNLLTNRELATSRERLGKVMEGDPHDSFKAKEATFEAGCAK